MCNIMDCKSSNVLYFDICNRTCLDTYNGFLALSLLLQQSSVFLSSTHVLTVFIAVVVMLSI